MTAFSYPFLSSADFWIASSDFSFFFSSYFFHYFSAPVRAYPTSQPFSSVFEPHTCISSDFETCQRIFRILGHIREFFSILSLFCRGATSPLQDAYQHIPTGEFAKISGARVLKGNSSFSTSGFRNPANFPGVV